ncbi:MAG TPA: hypothetical protein VNI61_05415 [Gemmatimonadales bacterium]|nr:hypothetical protein [Gemmatimonadales bacterium]
MKDDTLWPDGTSRDDELRAAAARLGSREADRLDVEAVARAVLDRLRTEPEAGRWSPRWVRPLALAAGLVLVAGTLVLARRWTTEAPAPASLAVAGDLNELSTAQLEELLATLDETLRLDPTGGATRTDDLDDLSEDQLRTVLHSLEG